MVSIHKSILSVVSLFSNAFALRKELAWAKYKWYHRHMRLGVANASRKNTRHSQRGKRLVVASKAMGKGGKRKKIICEGSGISKLDARVIVGLMRDPFRPNEATIEARKLGESIRRLAVH